jgi:hypothetical protein
VEFKYQLGFQPSRQLLEPSESENKRRGVYPVARRQLGKEGTVPLSQVAFEECAASQGSHGLFIIYPTKAGIVLCIFHEVSIQLRHFCCNFSKVFISPSLY